MCGTETGGELPRLELERPPRNVRWIGWAVLATAVGAISVASWAVWASVLPHLTAAAQLSANGMVAEWTIDAANWKRGGQTHLKFTRRWFGHLSNEHLALLDGLHRLTAVQLNDCDGITDEGMPLLARHPDLEDVSLDRAATETSYLGLRLTDRGLRALKGLTKLKRLSIRHAAVTDDGLEALERMVDLEELDLRGTPITDQGVARLARLPRLRWLEISDTAVTDAGVAHLKGSGHLSYLSVEETDVTPGAVEALQAALPPGCVIISGGKRAVIKRREVPR